MLVSIIGKKHGKELKNLLVTVDCLPKNLVFRTSQRKNADVWIMMDWDEEAFRFAKTKIRPQDIVILNCDDENLLQQMAGMVCHTVTFGYHLKSTITVSGREEDVTTGNVTYILALQRPVLTVSKQLLEPYELKWSVPKGISSQCVMAAVAFFLVAEVAFFP